jgi:hypothetical protein
MPAASSPPLWIARRSSIHHQGLFARSDIPADTPILEYTGEKITKAESERRGQALLEKSRHDGGAAVYIFTLNRRYDLDGGTTGNAARLINHSCDPNCEAFIERGRVWIYSKRAIAKGEELTYNYGFDLDTWEDHPCRCGTARCIGYIVDEDHWPKLRRILKKRDAATQKLANLEARAAELQRQLDELDDAAPVAAKKSANKAVKKVGKNAVKTARPDQRRTRN